jgi:hypothetical protein
MKNIFSVIVFISLVMALVTLVGRKFKISERYERKPEELSLWNSLDKGIDPTKGRKK